MRRLRCDRRTDWRWRDRDRFRVGAGVAGAWDWGWEPGYGYGLGYAYDYDDPAYAYDSGWAPAYSWGPGYGYADYGYGCAAADDDYGYATVPAATVVTRPGCTCGWETRTTHRLSASQRRRARLFVLSRIAVTAVAIVYFAAPAPPI